MAGSAGSTPTAMSPPATADIKPTIIRRPSLIMKPAQTPPAGSPPPNSAGTMSLTSKEWIIPPRPKPGRKPATDTPPSKRKAQNRAAQRAFRERRAARVNELEDQIKQIEDENDRETDALHSQVAHLEKEVEQYRTDLNTWAERCRRLEAELSNLRSSRSPQKTTSHAGDTSVGCGKCTLESRCQCIDDAFDTLGAQAQSTAEKRPRSPAPTGSGKRIKTEPRESLEIDFTAMFSRPSTSRAEDISPSSATVVADPCGFCSDGTPCICAEMAAEQEAARSATHPPQPTATRLPRLSQFTPPPSEGDVSMPSTSIPASEVSSTNPCANGPGTCAQCKADPNSTLFCKSLAASRSQSQSQPLSGGGCCGGRDRAGGCCQSQSQPSDDPATAAVPLPPRSRKTRSSARSAAAPASPARASSTSTTAAAAGAPHRTVTLTCADAYTTLSRHPAYERASAEITSWMPKLHASDSPAPMSGRAAAMEVGEGKGGRGRSAAVTAEPPRPAMEIDAANVMAVLRDFDRRFGRNG
ncbi:uncharacterized protein HMPREF1541_00596 [Cyphellophora europaea CBS 101466]|uniref:BZIP domain-containing protein n=1 Tax=Cyphellophora europaea (strain CBS 101466) TaxID=1220924 RepID=W2SCK3_CYPE1|nr:uncharacterized protein HMPREF1541_00596 [Cyphellophora europaea CBS 101466]ETN46412.1 hypothetical protein HMPREF1541_00596 [Cyphellophora europaea CBS 101466]